MYVYVCRLACEQPRNDSSMYVYFVVWLVSSQVMTVVCTYMFVGWLVNSPVMTVVCTCIL